MESVVHLSATGHEKWGKGNGCRDCIDWRYQFIVFYFDYFNIHERIWSSMDSFYAWSICEFIHIQSVLLCLFSYTVHVKQMLWTNSHFKVCTLFTSYTVLNDTLKHHNVCTVYLLMFSVDIIIILFTSLPIKKGSAMVRYTKKLCECEAFPLLWIGEVHPSNPKTER